MIRHWLHPPKIWILLLIITIFLIITSQLAFASGLQADTLSSVVRANDADFIVQETLDLDDVTPGDGLCTTLYGTCSLRAAITEANALPGEQRIYILPGTYVIRQGVRDADTNEFGDFDITDDLVISGYGINQTSIKEDVNIGSFERFFDVDPLQTGIIVTIANLSLYNIDVGGDDGTGVRNYGNLTLENIDVSNSVGHSMIYNAGTITINHSRFADNIIRNTVYNTASGNMTIRNSLITRNTTGNNNGAGLLNNGTILVENSTISYNRANRPAAGILNTSSGSNMTLNFVTLVGNHAGYQTSSTSYAGGFYNVNGGILTIRNSLITNNLSGISQQPANCATSLGSQTISQGYNVFGDGGCFVTGGDTSTDIVLPDTTSVLLDSQGNYGGSTETIPLLLGSPALNAANPADCPSTDQRGVTRPTACDVGAFERVSDSTLYPPTVAAVEINGINIEAQNLYPETTSQIAITFSENVLNPSGSSEPDDVTNPANYRVFSTGVNERVDSLICDVPQFDDGAIAIDAVSYDAANHRATLTLNGGSPLANGIYALLVCGTTSIVDSDGNSLDGDANGVGGDDYLLPFQLGSVGETAQTGPVFYVNITTDDANDGMCSTTHCTLRDAIRAANNLTQDATIRLSAETYTLSQTYPSLDESLWGDLDLLNNMTIEGAGASQIIIDGNHTGRVIFIDNNANVTLRNITVRGGDAVPEATAGTAYDGGGIFVKTGSLALYDSVVRDNYSRYSGGGIAFTREGKLATIQRSAIINNEAGRNGGGLVIYGVLPDINIINTTISGNVAGRSGGGIY